jgi:hypothetical protein
MRNLRMLRAVQLLLPTAVAGLGTIWIASAQQARKVDDAALKNAAKTGEDR